MLSSNRSTWKLPSGGCLKRPVDDGVNPSKSFGYGSNIDASQSSGDDLTRWVLNDVQWTSIPTNVSFIRVYLSADQHENFCFSWDGCDEGDRTWTCPVGSPCCSTLVGACCATGSDECTLATEAQCIDSDGAFLGAGTTCDPGVCDDYVLGRCCYDGACPQCKLCSTTTKIDCDSREGGSFTEGAECSGVFAQDCVDCGSAEFGGDPCGYCYSRACCTDSGCSVSLPCDCLEVGGEIQLPFLCNPDPCPQGCCFLDGSCENLPPAICSDQSGQSLGPGVLCGDVDCPDIVYCCNGSDCGGDCGCVGKFDDGRPCDDGSSGTTDLSSCQQNCGNETWCCNPSQTPSCFSVGTGVCPFGSTTFSCVDQCNDCCTPFTGNEEEGTATREFNPDGSLKPIYFPDAVVARVAVKGETMTLQQYKWFYGTLSSPAVLPKFDDQLLESYNAKKRSLNGFNVSQTMTTNSYRDDGIYSDEYIQSFQGFPECVICDQEGGIPGASFDCGAPDPAIVAIQYDITDVCEYDDLYVGIYKSNVVKNSSKYATEEEDIIKIFIAIKTDPSLSTPDLILFEDSFTSGWISAKSDPSGNVTYNCETCEWEFNCGSVTINQGKYDFIPALKVVSSETYRNTRTKSYVTTNNPREEPRNIVSTVLGVGEHINVVDELDVPVATLVGGASNITEPPEGNPDWYKLTNQLRYDYARIESEFQGDVYILGNALITPYATPSDCRDVVIDLDALTGVVFAGPENGCSGVCR